MSIGLEQPADLRQRFTSGLLTKGKNLGLIADPQSGSCLPQVLEAHRRRHNERLEFLLDKLAQSSNTRGRSLFFESKKAVTKIKLGEDDLPETSAHRLILDIIKNGDPNHAKLAMRAYFQYLQESRVMGAEFDIYGKEISSKVEKAVKYLSDYIEAEDPNVKRANLEKLVKETGFLYYEQGADKLTERSTEDRLVGFFASLKSNPSTRVLYDIVHDSGICDLMKDSLAIKDSAKTAIPDPLIRLESVQLSLQEININKATRSNVTDTSRGSWVRTSMFNGRLFGGGLKDITTSNPQELDFLKSLGLNLLPENATSYCFNFNKVNKAIYDINGSGLAGNDFGRKDIVNHFVGSYFLLIRRERLADGLIAQRKKALADNTDPTQRARLTQELKQAQKMKKQATKDLNNLGAILNNPHLLDADGEIVGIIQEEFKQKQASVLVMVAANLHRIELESSDSEAQKIVNLATKSWGAMAQVGTPADDPSSFDDLVTLRNDSVTKYNRLAQGIADSICEKIAPDQSFLKHEEVEKFQTLIQTRWNPSATSLVYQFSSGTSSANAQKQVDDIIARTLAGEIGLEYFDIEAASNDFKNFVTTCATDTTNPDQATYVYMLNNWDKVFGQSFSSFRFIPDGDDALTRSGFNLEKCSRRLFEGIIKPKEERGSKLERHLASSEYNQTAGKILTLSPTKLTAGEKIIRSVIDQLTEQEIKDGTLAREGENESTIRKMFRGEKLSIVGSELVERHADPQVRLASCMKIAQTIAHSSLSDLEKDSALSHIAIHLLGQDLSTYNYSRFLAQINSTNLPLIGDKSLAQGILRNKTTSTDDFATLEQLHFMTHEITDKGIDVVRSQVLGKREADLTRFMKCAYGNDAENAGTLSSTIATLTDRVGEGEAITTIKELADKISTTAKGTEEHNEAVSEYYNELRKLGINPEFDLGQYLTRDEYDETIPLLGTSLMQSSHANDFFSDMLKLIETIINRIVSGTEIGNPRNN